MRVSLRLRSTKAGCTIVREMAANEMPVRERAMQAIVLLGVAVFAITETLSAFGAVRRVPLSIAWVATACAGVGMARRRGWFAVVKAPRIDWVHFSHERYLVNQLRKRFGFEGTPIELKIRGRVKRSERKPLR